MSKSEKTLDICVHEDGVAVLTMCNGENKFNPSFVEMWHKALDNIEKSPSVRALITIGEGKFFSSGLDLQWLRQSSPRQMDEYHDELHRLYRRFISLGIVTVAVINGHAIAEGAFIALMHNYRIMRRDRGWIQWPEVHLGLPLTQTMRDLIRLKMPSPQVQREAILFGKRLNAEKALSMGLVDAVAKEACLMQEAVSTVKFALGKNVIGRDILRDMKNDLYLSQIHEETLIHKL